MLMCTAGVKVDDCDEYVQSYVDIGAECEGAAPSCPRPAEKLVTFVYRWLSCLGFVGGIHWKDVEVQTDDLVVWLKVQSSKALPCRSLCEEPLVGSKSGRQGAKNWCSRKLRPNSKSGRRF